MNKEELLKQYNEATHMQEICLSQAAATTNPLKKAYHKAEAMKYALLKTSIRQQLNFAK